MGSFRDLVDAMTRGGSFLACDGVTEQPRGQPGNAGQFASAAGAGSAKGKAKGEAAKVPKGKHAKTVAAVEEFVKGKLSPKDFAELQRLMNEAASPKAKQPKDRAMAPGTKALHDELEASIDGENGEKFWAAFEKAKKLPAKEAMNLAHAMSGGRITRNKSDALFYISNRQRQMELSFAKKRATGGRTAA